MKHMFNTIASTFMAVGISIATVQSLHAQEQKQPIIVATGIDPSFAQLVVAVEKGFLNEAGFNAVLRSFDDGNVALDALLTGVADIGNTSSVGALSRISKGGKLFTPGIGAYSDEFYAVTSIEAIKTPKDLEGRTIGIPGAASGGSWYFSKVIKKYDLDLSKITVKYMAAPESVAALSRGDIDALSAWEPWPSRAVSMVKGAHVLERSTAETFPAPFFIWYSQRFADDADAAKRATKAIVEAGDWIEGNFDEAVKIVATTFRMKEEDVRPMMEIMNQKLHFDEALMRRILDDAGEFMKSVKLLEEAPAFESYTRPDILKSVYPDRVK